MSGFDLTDGIWDCPRAPERKGDAAFETARAAEMLRSLSSAGSEPDHDDRFRKGVDMSFTLLDVVIAFFALGAASAGFRLGFLARSAGWVGVLAGLSVAAFAVEPVVAWVGATEPIVSVLVAAGTILAFVFVGQATGLSVGHLFRRRVARQRSARLVDSIGGAVAGVFGVLIIIWLLLPGLAVVPGDVAAAVRNSAVVDAVEGAAPEPPQALRDLGRRIDQTDFPEVFAGMRPAPELSPAPSEIPLRPHVVDQVRPSVVNVETEGCGGIQEGSGFVVAQDVVVTNAHVVAGSEVIEVLRNDGKRLRATLVNFDPRRDLAVLRVPGIQRRPLPLTKTASGATGAVFGHPGGQDALRIAPARISDVIDAVGRDIYGRSRVRRRVAVVASDLEPGDSGAALVTGDGHVSGVAFAIAPDQPGTAYALATSELRAVLAEDNTGAIPSGSCV